MSLSIKQIQKNVEKNGNILGIHNETGLLMEFEQIRLSDGFIFKVVSAEHQTPDTLQGLTYSSEDVTLFDKFMRPYTQTTSGRIMHTIDPKTLIDGGFHGYSRNN